MCQLQHRLMIGMPLGLFGVRLLFFLPALLAFVWLLFLRLAACLIYPPLRCGAFRVSAFLFGCLAC